MSASRINTAGGALAVFAGVFARGGAASAVDDAAWLQALLDVEAGLARALARTGLVSVAAAEAVTAAARAERFSAAELGQAAAEAGNPIPALVAALTRELGSSQPDAARAVHLGATSQDIIDSALVLLLSRALPHIARDLRACAERAAQLASAHRDTLMLGRTLLQAATPVTFGLKAAGWLHALDRVHAELAASLRARLPVQFGGAAGTLAALEDRGLDVMRELARELELACPALPWHTERLPLLEVAGLLARIAAVSGKIAHDVTLLAQSEVAEVRERSGQGRGGSSAMPHKQNPIASISAVSCSRRVPGLYATLLAAAEQEHERAAGSWHVEWETLTDLVRLVGSSVSWLRDTLEGLEVDAARMRANLDAARGLPLAERLSTLLTPALGRKAAQALVADACARVAQSGQSLLACLQSTPELQRALPAAGIDDARLQSALDPAGYLGSTRALIERALAAHANYERDGS